LDCPISSEDPLTIKMIVAVHNPSMAANEYIRIAVPHANFKVAVFDEETSLFVNSKQSVVLCDDEEAY